MGLFPREIMLVFNLANGLCDGPLVEKTKTSCF